MGCIELLRELIRFGVVNPPGSEKPATQCLTGLLQTTRFRCEVQDLGGNRVNLITILGGGDGPELMLTGHLDVVPTVGVWDSSPFSMAEKGDRLHGRRTSDMKGEITTMYEAAMGCAAKKEPVRGSLKLLFVVDKECSNLGTLSCLKTHRGSGYATIGESIRLEVAVAHRGVSRDYIDIEGAPRHAALPAGEEDAVVKACRAVLVIDDMNGTLRHVTHSVLPPPGTTVTMVERYERGNVVPRNVCLLLDFRIHPGMDHEQVGRFLNKGFEQAGIDGCQRMLRYYMSGGEIRRDNRSVKLYLGEWERPLGIRSFPQSFEVSCGQCFLTEQGIRTVICDPSDIVQARTIGEFAREKQVWGAMKLYGRIIGKIPYKTKYNQGEIVTIKDAYGVLKEKGIILPQPPAKGGAHAPVQESGDKPLCCSDCGPGLENGNTVVGKSGKDLAMEEGQRAAYNCMLNLLVNLNDKTRDLNRIKRFVKVLALVGSTDDFGMQPRMMSGGSNLIAELSEEEAGFPAHSATGTNALPGGIAYEIEALVELRQKHRQQRKS